MKITLIATTKFGLEMIVKQEVQALGFTEIVVSDGRIEFQATLADIPKANLWLRCADRVLLKMAGAIVGLTASTWIRFLTMPLNGGGREWPRLSSPPQLALINFLKKASLLA